MNKKFIVLIIGMLVLILFFIFWQPVPSSEDKNTVNNHMPRTSLANKIEEGLKGKFPKIVEVERDAGIIPGTEILVIRLENVNNSKYLVKYKEKVFTYGNGKFAGEVPEGTKIKDLIIRKR